MTDIDRVLGSLTAEVQRLQRDVAELQTMVRAQSEQLNRWRGAGAVLVLVGAAIGTIATFLLGLIGR